MFELVSTAKIFSEQLLKLGAKYKNLVILESDLRNQTGSLNFAKTFPDRHFSFPLSENAMIGASLGFLARNKITFCLGNSSTMLSNGWTTIREQIATHNLNTKLIGFNSGLSSSENGLNDQMTEDLSLLLSLPNLQIYTPIDANDLKNTLDEMTASYGPAYLRLPKNLLINASAEESAKPNVFKSYQVMKQGENIALLTFGSLLPEIMATAAELEKKGISVSIIAINQLKPWPADLINQLLKNQIIISIEDHQTYGGLGSYLKHNWPINLPHKPIHQIGAQHLYEAAKVTDLLQKHQLNSKGLYEQIRNIWVNS